jgi:hypothetical protein
LIQVKAAGGDRFHRYAMTRSFSSFALAPEQTAVVFPLVHAAIPEITLDAWRGFLRAQGEGAGALGLRNEAGYICGLLLFRAEHDLRHGRLLAINLFIALDLVNEEEAASALLHAAEAKARELGCAATHIRVDAAQKSLAQRFSAAGYRNEADLFCRAIGAELPPS